ncbi:MAG TPA: hypothetical protein VIQ27_04400 [Gemmatimonadales bacterium]|jgi:hypothetical protein
MRALTSCCIALLLIGCEKPADKPEDTTVGEAPAAEAMPAGTSLADLAGTWNVRSTLDGSDKVITYDIATTEDGSGWTLKFPDRDPIPLRLVATEGDSVVWEAGPFESVIRKGVQVKVSRTVARLQDGKLVGRTTATYEGKGADSVATLTLEGTRAP